MKKVSFLILLIFSANLTASETWKYKIKYLGISVADVVFEHEEKMQSISVRANSAGFATIFQKMDNSYQVDYSADFLPQIYRKKTDQKDFFENLTMNYHHKKLFATANDSIHNEIRTYEIFESTRDFFSALYYLCENGKDKGEFFLDAREVMWKATYKKVTNEKIKIDKHKKMTDVYEIGFEKLSDKKMRRSDLLTNNLVNEKNKLYFWITADEKRIPVLAKYKMSPFSVSWEIVNLKEIYAE